jgi:hypothetical protein
MSYLAGSADSSVLAREQFESAYQIFYSRVQKEQLMCDIYECFDEPGSRDHNCLGCNFDDMTAWILNFLQTCKDGSSPYSAEQSFAIYVLLLNLLWERICDVFDLLGVPQAYRSRHFGAFSQVRKWANLFKHPKAFAWMVHHPVYTFEGSAHSASFSDNTSYLRIDDEFVKEYYASKNARGLTSLLERHQNTVVVVLPDLEQLTTAICASLERFVKMITESMVYREILGEKSTLVDYFAALDAAPPPFSEP